MHCMKCGREIQEQQVFCPDCLAHMAENPVKAGTAIKLPPRSIESLPKKRAFRKRRERKPEEIVLQQRILIRRLILLLLGATLLLLAAGFLLIWIFRVQNFLDVTDLIF